jgi:hypothetical protein
MGTWGVGIFADDSALDIRDSFRELVGAGYSSEDAVERLVSEGHLGEIDRDEVAADWISLAVTQWKTGRLLDSVRDRALDAMAAETEALWGDPKLWRKRAKVLDQTARMLRSPQRTPTKIKTPPMLLSPFAEGDVIRFTMTSGREVAVWVMSNKLHESLTATSVESEFQLIAFGEPELPDLETLISREPACLTHDDGSREVAQFVLYRPQTAKPPDWQIIGNAPFVTAHRTQGADIWVLNQRGVDPVDRANRLFQSKYELSQAPPTPEILSAQRLVDAFPELDGMRNSWPGHPALKAQHIAIEFAQRIQDGRPAPPDSVFSVTDELLQEEGPPRWIGLLVVQSLLNLASHPELTITRETLLAHLGPVAQSSIPKIDGTWASIRTVERPKELDDLNRGRAIWPTLYVGEFMAWRQISRVRRLDDGTYAMRAKS